MADPDERLAALLASARETLAVEASPEAVKRIDERLRAIAAELALEWITGARRFENQSQQTEHWLARLYEELFPDEQPDATRLYARFSLPLPRAQYLARLLLARRTAQWREAARREVLVALESFEDKAKEAEKCKAARTQRFDLSLSRGGYEQLIVIYDFLAGSVTGQNRPAPPKRNPSSGSLVWFSLTAETVLALLTEIRKGPT
jgi:hypothetical protein